MRTVALVLLLGTAAACGRAVPGLDLPPPPPPPPAPPAGAPLPALGDPLRSAHADEIAFCVEQTNAYRGAVGRAALTQSADLDLYAAVAAQHDAAARVPHGLFSATSGGGVAMAENAIPWWSLLQFGTVREIVRQGLAAMWAEGPGGGHYDNMIGPYTEVGCGIVVSGDRVTAVQAFR
jgi:hypothetical protein